jgi:hypothetical protein
MDKLCIVRTICIHTHVHLLIIVLTQSFVRVSTYFCCVLEVLDLAFLLFFIFFHAQKLRHYLRQVPIFLQRIESLQVISLVTKGSPTLVKVGNIRVFGKNDHKHFAK